MWIDVRFTWLAEMKPKEFDLKAKMARRFDNLVLTEFVCRM